MDPYLKATYEEACQAADEGGVPIGSGLVVEGRIVGLGHNRQKQLNSIIRHAAMDCVDSAASLNFAVSYDKDFIERDALLRQKLKKPERIQVCFEIVERGVAREHYPVLHCGKEVGFVSSGMFSPTTKKYLGMAYMPREVSMLGTELDIVIRTKPVKAGIIKKPFSIPAYRRHS